MEIVKPVERQMTNKEVQAMGKLVVKGEDAAVMSHIGSHTVRLTSRFSCMVPAPFRMLLITAP